MNDQISMYIKKRLEEWTDWYSRGNWYGLGYPSCSLEYRLMKEGIISKSTGPKKMENNEAAEEIEQLVMEISEHNYDMALALRCHYFSEGSLRIKAKKIEISHMKFKYLLDMAHQCLAGRLTFKKT